MLENWEHEYKTRPHDRLDMHCSENPSLGGTRFNKTKSVSLIDSNAGKRSFHIQKSTCANCGYPAAKTRKCTNHSYFHIVFSVETSSILIITAKTKTDNWSEKAKRRKTTGSGRMRYLKTVDRKFKNGFQTGAPKDARGPKVA